MLTGTFDNTFKKRREWWFKGKLVYVRTAFEIKASNITVFGAFPEVPK